MINRLTLSDVHLQTDGREVTSVGLQPAMQTPRRIESARQTVGQADSDGRMDKTENQADWQASSRTDKQIG